MTTSKFENNEQEMIFVVMSNTTTDKVHDNYEYVYGFNSDRYTRDISDANHFDTYEEALAAINNHDFVLNGIGHLWGAQLHIVKFEKEYYIDKNEDEKISYLELESEMIWSQE